MGRREGEGDGRGNKRESSFPLVPLLYLERWREREKEGCVCAVISFPVRACSCSDQQSSRSFNKGGEGGGEEVVLRPPPALYSNFEIFF